MIADSRTALIIHLKANADIIAQVGTRVFGDEVPESEAVNMPRKCLVIRQSGGAIPTWAMGDLPLQIQRIDVICYGGTFTESEDVRRAAYTALKSIRRVTVSNVLIHWARPAGGAVHGRESAEIQWPFKWNSWQICSDERATA